MLGRLRWIDDPHVGTYGTLSVTVASGELSFTPNSAPAPAASGAAQIPAN